MKRTLKIIAKTLLVIVIILAFVAGGGYAYLRYTSSQSTASTLASLQTARLATGTISTTISATGTVRTNQTAQVTWQASGKVGKILVKVGDTVKANDLLANLDVNSLPSTIIAAQEDLATAQQALTDLKNNQSDLPTAELAVLTAQTAVDTAQTARNYLNGARGTTSQIAAAEASYLLAKQKVDQLQAFYNATPGDPTTDAAKALALSNLSAAKTALASAEYNDQWFKSTPSATEIATADTNLALAKAKLADAQAAVTKLKSGPDASELASAEQRIAADQATINSQYIYAPFAGTISTISSMTGDMVSSGTTAFRIDDTSAFFIDLSVSEVDIAKVQVGQTTNITFDAIADKTYTGTVTKVGQVGSSSSGTVNFTVTVQITNADTSIKPGMTASCEVVISSVSDVFVVSTKAIKTINNQKYVYILTTTGATLPANNSQTSASGTRQAPTANNNNAGTSSTGANPQVTTTPGANNPQVATTPGARPQVVGTAGANPQTATTPGANPPAAPAVVQQIVPVKVEVGASNDTQTQITSSQLKAGDLIVTNPTSSTTTTTISSQNNLGLAGLLGGLLGGNVTGGGGMPGGGPGGGGGAPPSGGPGGGGGAPPSGGGGGPGGG